MQKLQKHRLILLLGVLVALIFFYLGVNTWMETQERRTAPPPVVRTKPPVQIKPEAKQVKPQTPKPPQAQKTPPRKPEKKVVQKKQPQKPARTAEAKKPQPQKQVPVKKAPPQKKQPQPQKKPAPAPMKEFVAQIGAFKLKSNAEKSLALAKKKGFTAFIVEENGLYKVRVRFKAKNLRSALRTVRRDFSGAFIVR